MRERLDALLAGPSTAKDLAGKAGGVAMAWFATLADRVTEGAGT